MIADYKDFSYYFEELDERIALVTNNISKKIDGFEPEYDYFYKEVSLNDEDLKSVYDIHFWVKYCDSVETEEIWLADCGRPIGIRVPDINVGEIIIEVSHNAKDKSWTTYENGAAAKIINISDCQEYKIEKTYHKRDGKIVDKEKETLSVSMDEFKEMMMDYDWNLI